ncbi:hypothetical protein Glove_155g144 [Diversispora epigaea]|uniref:DUF659 domain-containing protein n=1 Tax=Diversispora epigaea TaxID=1348612 RepID=A0A397IW22_9GLOM|nr:hypothetical protein Glove_155g144 [Diversispora epigaea]
MPNVVHGQCPNNFLWTQTILDNVRCPMSKDLSNQLVVIRTCPTEKLNFIIKTNEKINKSNIKVYCKLCVKILGEIEGKKTSFPNKKDRLIIHFKKCSNFFNETTPDIREEIFNLIKKNNTNTINSTNIQLGKRKELSFETASSISRGSKTIVRSSSYGTMDNYIVRPLSLSDIKKFYTLLLRLSLSCGWALHWINKPEAKELFQFLNPYLILPDRRLLGGRILSDAVKDSNDTMIKVFQEDSVGVTLTFDRWTNVRNEQLLGVKATDISSERETHVEIMEKTKEMYLELNNNGITVCTIVTDSAPPYAGID